MRRSEPGRSRPRASASASVGATRMLRARRQGAPSTGRPPSASPSRMPFQCPAGTQGATKLAEITLQPREAATRAPRTVRAARRDRDRRMRALTGLRHEAHAEFRDHRLGDARLPGRPGDVVGRIAGPDALDDIERFQHPPPALHRHRLPEQLEVGGEPARPDAEDEPSAAHVVELRHLGGDDRRVGLGRLMTPVPKVSRVVRCTSPAMNISGEAIGSEVAEKCSPHHRSSKPSRSASSDFSVSSASVSCIGRRGGCSGIMNRPRRWS